MEQSDMRADGYGSLAEGRDGQPVRLPVNVVLAGYSPRLNGESEEHIRLLADSAAPLPPILVHRATMRVIDGMHRLRAALLRGEQTVEVEFFDGSDESAFVTAVRANTEHGLPLSLADREAAAARILAAGPIYSDRRLAAIAGLSPSTVAAIRRRVAPAYGGTRLGQDGRVRPVSSADGRRVARDEIIANPEASLREIARKAGVSPATVIDVRERMNRGEDPVPAGQIARGQAKPQVSRGVPTPRRSSAGAARGAIRRRALLVQALRKDPSLRFTEAGRTLLRSLTAWANGPGPWQRVIDSVPPHSAYLVAELARSCAEEWLDFAVHLERRLASAPNPNGGELTRRWGRMVRGQHTVPLVSSVRRCPFWTLERRLDRPAAGPVSLNWTAAASLERRRI